MKPTRLLWLAVFALGLVAQEPQGALTNMRVGDLVRMGVSTPEILRIIGSAQTINFDLRPGSTDNLLKAGVSEEIIKAMAAREAGTVPVSAPAPARQKLPLTPAPDPRSGNPRVFIQDSNDSWSFTANRHFAQGSTHPQTVEVIKTFAQSCPNMIVTNDPAKADYKVTFERESNKLVRRHNKFAAFNSAGDLVYASSTRELGNAVRGFCSSIQ